MAIDKDNFYDTLSEALDPKSGRIQPIDSTNEKYWKKVLDIEWKGNIHFIVTKSLFRRGLAVYYVMRDMQLLSPQYHAAKTDEALLRSMQHIIDDIDNGKFRNKKTYSEKIKAKVEERCLTSYMNNTKWHELLDAMMEKVPNNCMKYKTVFEDDEPAEYWDIFSDEELAHMNLAEIEWLKISSILKESRYIGALLPCQITEYDKKEEILQIMREYNIPYEYDENEKIFIVYGYK